MISTMHNDLARVRDLPSKSKAFVINHHAQSGLAPLVIMRVIKAWPHSTSSEQFRIQLESSKNKGDKKMRIAFGDLTDMLKNSPFETYVEKRSHVIQIQRLWKCLNKFRSNLNIQKSSQRFNHSNDQVTQIEFDVFF